MKDRKIRLALLVSAYEEIQKAYPRNAVIWKQDGDGAPLSEEQLCEELCKKYEDTSTKSPLDCHEDIALMQTVILRERPLKFTSDDLVTESEFAKLNANLNADFAFRFGIQFFCKLKELYVPNFDTQNFSNSKEEQVFLREQQKALEKRQEALENLQKKFGKKQKTLKNQQKRFEKRQKALEKRRKGCSDASNLSGQSESRDCQWKRRITTIISSLANFFLQRKCKEQSQVESDTVEIKSRLIALRLAENKSSQAENEFSLAEISRMIVGTKELLEQLGQKFMNKLEEHNKTTNLQWKKSHRIAINSRTLALISIVLAIVLPIVLPIIYHFILPSRLSPPPPITPCLVVAMPGIPPSNENADEATLNIKLDIPPVTVIVPSLPPYFVNPPTTKVDDNAVTKKNPDTTSSDPPPNGGHSSNGDIDAKPKTNDVMTWNWSFTNHMPISLDNRTFQKTTTEPSFTSTVVCLQNNDESEYLPTKVRRIKLPLLRRH